MGTAALYRVCWNWFEVDLGFTELSFIQIDLCVLCLYRSPALYTYTVTGHIFQSCIHTQSLHTQSLHMHSHCIHCIRLESYIQPIAFGVSLNLYLPSHSPWSLFIGTWQKRPRELDYRLRLEIEGITLRMQYISSYI